jgi:hypothetical protein
MLLRLLRQVSAVIAKELAGPHAAEMAAQPGRILFPKRVHDLGGLEPDAPDSLDVAFVRMAAGRNAAALKEVPVDTAVATLATHVTDEIGRAVLLERSIVELLKALG